MNRRHLLVFLQHLKQIPDLSQLLDSSKKCTNPSLDHTELFLNKSGTDVSVLNGTHELINILVPGLFFHLKFSSLCECNQNAVRDFLDL